MRRPRKAVHPIISQIIDRDCHVGQSDGDVLKHVVGKLRHGLVTFRLLKPEDQERFAQDCLIQHRGNQDLYRQVMQGLRGPAVSSAELRVLAKSLVAELLSSQAKPTSAERLE
jgi:hypothetical protein